MLVRRSGLVCSSLGVSIRRSSREGPPVRGCEFIYGGGRLFYYYPPAVVAGEPDWVWVLDLVIPLVEVLLAERCFFQMPVLAGGDYQVFAVLAA